MSSWTARAAGKWIGVHFTPAITWSRAYLDDLARCRVTGLAAELAFWMFLSLVPLAAVLGLVAARLTMSDQALLHQLTTALPSASRVLVLNEVAHVSAWNGGAVGPVATIVFVWLGSAGIHAIFDAVELTSHARPRSWVRKRALSILACVGLSVGTALVVVLGVGVGSLRHRFGPSTVFITSGVWWSAVRGVCMLGVAVGMMTGLYAIASPRTPGRPVRLLPGACLAVLAQVCMGLGYAALVATTGDGGAYLAGLAVIGVTMTALYLSALSLLMGATLNHFLVDRAISEATRQPERPT